MKYVISIFVFLFSLSAFSADHLIGQKDKKFIAPGGGEATAVIKVKMGDTITFKNDDTFQHNVYSLSPGNAFELKTQDPGKTSTINVDPAKFKGGEMQVECAIHPAMKVKFQIEK